MSDQLKELAANALGGEGYREWLADKFEPGAAQVLQARYDKLCEALAQDIARGMVEEWQG